MALEEFGQGKCINCGFLGKRASQSTVSVCYEATVIDRKRGQFTDCDAISTYAWCFVRGASIGDEVSKIEGDRHFFDKMKEVIERDRCCPSWYKWTEFESPKEHYEEFKMLQLERNRQEFEQRIEDDRRKWELELQRLNEESRKRTNSVMIRLTVLIVLFAICQLAVTILQIVHSH